MFKETGKDAHVLAIFYLPVLNRKQVIATVRSQTLKMAETCILDLLYRHTYIYIYILISLYRRRKHIIMWLPTARSCWSVNSNLSSWACRALHSSLETLLALNSSSLSQTEVMLQCTKRYFNKMVQTKLLTTGQFCSFTIGIVGFLLPS